MSSQQTLLMLGGSQSQLIGIKKAKELGYRTVVCDYLPDNPGQHLADAFRLVSTTDKDAVLAVACEENIDGVVAYGSDPAAPTAAYVAEQLGLPGVPYKIAEAFCNKHLFRDFLNTNGFNVPKSVRVESDAADVQTLLDGFIFPVIVKPTDSSGSKGVTVIREKHALIEALDAARAKGRNGICIVEEYIERDHAHVIEAELFVVGGEVKSWGLINSIRDSKTNPLLPAAYTYPLALSEERIALVKAEISRLIKATGVQYGAFNLEMIVDSSNRLFFLDAGPRNGGNMLPQFINMVGGKDTIEATMLAAMGAYDEVEVGLDNAKSYCGLAVLHSDKAGTFAGIEYSSVAKECLVEEHLNVVAGEAVSSFEVCSDLVGLSFFKFNDKKTMEDVMEHPYEHMKVVSC